MLDAKIALTGAPDEQDQSKRARYEKEQEEIKSEAEGKQAAAKSYFHKHEVFARAVTMFQIAIAIAAISALTKKALILGCEPGIRRGWLRVSRPRRDDSMTRDRELTRAPDRRQRRWQFGELF